MLGYMGVFKNDIIATSLIQLLVMFAMPLLLYTFLISKNFKKTLKDTGFKQISVKMLLLTILIGIILYVLNTFIADFFASIISLLGFESLTSPEPVKFDYYTLLKELALSALVPAICEEVLHRGILLHAGKRQRNTRFCLIISSILFGLTHLNINQFFYATILGFLIGHVSLMAGSIYPAMILHFINNALSTYFYYGAVLNWPFASKVNMILTMLLNNIALFFVVIIMAICILTYLYVLLSRLMFVERKKFETSKVIKKMRAGKLSIDDAILRVNKINELFTLPRKQSRKAKSNLSTNIFIICSMILGILITISSFVWGIL